MISKKKGADDFLSFLTTIFSITVIGIVVALLVRLQRGFLGLILSGIAIVLLTFWLKELRAFLKNKSKIFGSSSIRISWNKDESSVQERKDDSWSYDIFDDAGEKVLVARVPGPEERVKTRIKKNKLKIFGGQGFSKILIMPDNIKINSHSYKNGVLIVRFSSEIKEIERL
jgi:HSP20 family molecular chaperone IbpA